MDRIYTRVAAVLAVVIGLMAAFAGGKVLLGQDPGYYIIDWVPVYNFTVGVISAGLVSVLLWRNSRYASAVALVVLALHSTVMFILQAVYADVVATESVRAMTIRIATWLVIGGLLVLQRRHGRSNVRSSERPAL